MIGVNPLKMKSLRDIVEIAGAELKIRCVLIGPAERSRDFN